MCRSFDGTVELCRCGFLVRNPVLLVKTLSLLLK